MHDPAVGIKHLRVGKAHRGCAGRQLKRGRAARPGCESKAGGGRGTQRTAPHATDGANATLAATAGLIGRKSRRRGGHAVTPRGAQRRHAGLFPGCQASSAHTTRWSTAHTHRPHLHARSLHPFIVGGGHVRRRRRRGGAGGDGRLQRGLRWRSGVQVLFRLCSCSARPHSMGRRPAVAWTPRFSCGTQVCVRELL